GEGASGRGPRPVRSGGERAAREPATGTAGPPVSDAGPPARQDSGGGRGVARRGPARLLGRGGDRRVRGDRGRIRSGAPRPGPSHRGRAETGREAMSTRRIAVLAATFLLGTAAAQAESPARPRLLLAERDPFTGLPALK